MQNVQDDALLAGQPIANVRNMVEPLPHLKKVALAFRHVEKYLYGLKAFILAGASTWDKKKNKRFPGVLYPLVVWFANE
jgi:hypothetical protein